MREPTWTDDPTGFVASGPTMTTGSTLMTEANYCSLERLADLKEGWDGYHAPPVSKAAIATCRLLHFTPLGSGGIMIEMHTNEGSVEIEVDEFGRLSGSYVDLSTAKTK